MAVVESVRIRSSEMGDLFSFLWINKLWFLIPFVAVLLIFATILFFASATGVAPLIYTII